MPHAVVEMPDMRKNAPSTHFSSPLEGCTAFKAASDLAIQPDVAKEMLSFYTAFSP